MIVGTGIDVCEVERMRSAITSGHGKRFLERVFTPDEVAYAESKANSFERFAARFAAKEAALKALGTGWGEGASWLEVEVRNQPSGRPELILHGKTAAIADRLGVKSISVSLSHTATQAMAIVILES